MNQKLNELVNELRHGKNISDLICRMDYLSCSIMFLLIKKRLTGKDVKEEQNLLRKIKHIQNKYAVKKNVFKCIWNNFFKSLKIF